MIPPAGEPRITVDVPPPDRPYEVIVARGALRRVGDLVGGRTRVAVVSQVAVADRYGAVVLDAVGGSGELLLMGDGEAAKTLRTVEELCRRFTRTGLGRADAVVALGGGVVGDTAGFAAAVYHRGIDVVQVPTTLLAMVDAAIGGKTAVNLPEGKNLVGAFHQPVGVVADPDTLATLPRSELACGLGEVAKYALIADAEGDPTGLLELLRLRADPLRAGDPDTLVEVVRRCAAMKAAVVADDPHERTGRRAVLNLGHTLGHALEVGTDFGLTHGEAVAIGLVFAGALAGACGRVGPDVVDRYQGIVAGLGLPDTVPSDAAVRAEDLLPIMRRDKKATGGLTFVLPGPGGITPVHDPPPEALAAAFAAVGIR